MSEGVAELENEIWQCELKVRTGTEKDEMLSAIAR